MPKVEDDGGKSGSAKCGFSWRYVRNQGKAAALVSRQFEAEKTEEAGEATKQEKAYKQSNEEIHQLVQLHIRKLPLCLARKNTVDLMSSLAQSAETFLVLNIFFISENPEPPEHPVDHHNKKPSLFRTSSPMLRELQDTFDIAKRGQPDTAPVADLVPHLNSEGIRNHNVVRILIAATPPTCNRGHRNPTKGQGRSRSDSALSRFPHKANNLNRDLFPPRDQLGGITELRLIHLHSERFHTVRAIRIQQTTPSIPVLI
ncbi:hypothetical protein LXL04_006315 [Taraxacum kok-saghyz]